MTQTITITLSDTDFNALEYDAVSVQTWAENFIEVKSEKSKKKIIAKLVDHCNANSVALAVGEAAQITQAYTLNVVDTAANVQAAQLAAQQAD